MLHQLQPFFAYTHPDPAEPQPGSYFTYNSAGQSQGLFPFLGRVHTASGVERCGERRGWLGECFIAVVLYQLKRECVSCFASDREGKKGV